jgi:hypothetical protein
MISEYGKYVAMIGIGVLAIICWLFAWDSQVPVRVRWSFFWFGLIFMGFELCIIAVDTATT